MNKTNCDNLEDRFDAGDDVLDIHRLKEISAVLKLSALAREAGMNPHTLRARIRRETPLSAPNPPPSWRPPQALPPHRLVLGAWMAAFGEERFFDLIGMEIRAFSIPCVLDGTAGSS